MGYGDEDREMSRHMESIRGDMVWQQCWECRLDAIMSDRADMGDCPDPGCDGMMVLMTLNSITGQWMGG